MDWFPLFNSIRIAAISTVIIFFAGIFTAYYVAKAPKLIKGVLDVLLTLPLKWVLVNIAVSAVVLLAVNLLERQNRKRVRV